MRAPAGINRAIVALLGAGAVIQSGVLDQEEAIKGIDFNTIALLTGMMILVAIARKSGMFQYVAVWSAKKARAEPWGILLMLSVTTALLSALLDNVTTVLLVVPVTLLGHYARVHAVDYLLGQVYLDPHPRALKLRNHA